MRGVRSARSRTSSKSISLTTFMNDRTVPIAPIGPFFSTFIEPRPFESGIRLCSVTSGRHGKHYTGEGVSRITPRRNDEGADRQIHRPAPDANNLGVEALHRVDQALDRIRRLAKRRCLIVLQVDLHDRFETRAPELHRHADVQVVDAVFA